MSQNETESSSSEDTTEISGTSADSGDTETPETKLSNCDICKAALEGACLAVIVGGIIVAEPEEALILAIVAALNTIGKGLDGNQIRAWITEAIAAGIKTADKLAEFICKKIGIC